MTSVAYDAFFARAFGRDPVTCKPHPYQRSIASEHDLPEFVSVPTGCGKTAALVLGWLWRRFNHEDTAVRASTPRRLVYCLPMRTLVEQVRSNVVLWLKNLDLLAGETDDNQRARYRPSWVAGRVPVFTLMGGEERVDWQAYPEREAILIGTQDMLLSRALNRGYGLFPAYWPIDFGIINADALWVLDEVQLMGVGRTTSAQLQLLAPASSEHVLVPRRHTVWMSATLGAHDVPLPDAGRGQIEVPAWMHTPDRDDDSATFLLQSLSKDERRPAADGDEPTSLQAVVHAVKHLDLRITGARRWTADSDELLNAVLAEAQECLTLVVTNTVARARVLHEKLQAKTADRPVADRPETAMLHSRYRPWDRAREMDRVSSEVPTAGRIVVSTQVLEAGVDLDADRLFTEIAPWPSLVQRFGRLNRKGRRHDARAVVFDVPFDDSKARKLTKKDEREKALVDAQTKAARPYDWEDIHQGRSQLERLGTTLPTLDRLPDLPLPLEGPVLRRFHIEDAFDTDPDLSGGHIDVSGFIRARERDLDVYLLWRCIRADLDEQPSPHPDEICAVPIYELIQTLRGQRAFRLGFGKKRRGKHAWEELTITEGRVRVGDTIMVDLDLGGYVEENGWLGSVDSGATSQKPSTYIARHNDRRVWLRRTPAGLQVVMDIDHRIAGYSGRDRDPRSFVHRWMTLEEHLNAARERAREIVGGLVSPMMMGRVALAARWHDVGKALERPHRDGTVTHPFQEMLRSAGKPEAGHPGDGVLYAKSNRRGGKPAGFRHEVASALAYLEVERDPDDLIAYLIMCHHGKVRLLPEPWDEHHMNDANGVRPGDRV
ncbi:MAG: DEAD/DEAH box helicase [Gammaproteobacteria bacterium]|nr:DEAD/DEAH box helicase [Gammaproteobacteria bacterium]